MLFNTANIKTPKQTNAFALKQRKNVGFANTRLLQIAHVKELLGQLPQPGELVLVHSLNAFSAFDYVLFMLKTFGTLQELVISTYNMSNRVADTIAALAAEQRLQRTYIVINEKHKLAQADRRKFGNLASIGQNHGITLHFMPNHTKNILIIANNTHYVWFGSGNAGSNAQMEDYAWLTGEEIYTFKKNYLLYENN